MTIEHKELEDLKSRFEDGDRPTGEDFARLLDSCHNTYQDTSVTITGDLGVESGATIQGTTTLNSSLSVGSTAVISGAVTLNSTLGVTSATTLHGTLAVTGASTLNNTLTVGSTLTVTGASTLNNTLTVAGATNINNNLNVTGLSTIDGTLSVAQATTLNSTLSVTSNTNVGGVLIVEQSGTFNDDLTVTKTTTLKDVDISESLDNTGTTTLNGTNLLTGDTTISGNLNTNNTTINGELHAKQPAIFDKDLHIKGDLRVDGNAYLSAGANGNINVGDSEGDNIIFHGDINSDVNVTQDATYNLGSDNNKWNNLYVENVVVDGAVDGRDVSDDGAKLDSTHSTVNSNSGDWKWTHETVDDKYLDWNSTHVTVDSNSGNWDNTYTIVDNNKQNWSSVYNSTNTNSGNWDSTYSNVKANSADWEIDTLVALKDVDASGIENNSILRYETGTGKWVASTVEDEVVKATAALIVHDHGGDDTIPVDGHTLVLTDNYQDGPYRVVTFTADSFTLSGNNIKSDAANYTYGTSGLSAVPTNQNLLAQLVVNAVNYANSQGDLSILAGRDNNRIILQQQFGGPGGNTDIAGTSTGNSNDAFLHDDNGGTIHNPAFTGGANLNTFASMDDTPAGYGGDAGKFVKVNSTNDGLEFIAHDDTVFSVVQDNSASWEETADINAIVNSIGGVSADWDSVYSNSNTNSGRWEDVYTDVSETSADWNSVYSSVENTSADWNSVYSNSNTNSGRWEDVYTDVSTTSADWNSVYSSVENTSADWNSVYSWVNSDSATNSSDYNQTAFVNASGDTIDGNLSVTGYISARGDIYLAENSLQFADGETFGSEDSQNSKSAYTFINSSSGTGTGFAVLDSAGKLETAQIPELSITRVHVAATPSDVQNLAPASGLQEGDVVLVESTYDNLILVDTDPQPFALGLYDAGTKAYAGYNKLRLPADLVQTVNQNLGPHVVLTPDDLDDTTTANKFVAQTDIDNWNDTRTTVDTYSASWEETADIIALGNSIATLSGDWESTHLSVNSNSANWDSVYTDVSETSADWNSTYSNSNANSGRWEDVYTDVAGASADWNSTYSNSNTNSGRWEDVYTDVSTTSADWDSVYSWVNGDSATNNTEYNQTTFINTSGDTVNGELIVEGNITLAADLIHKNDTGTRISYSQDKITLETNGQEFITLDGTGGTPDEVIINEPGSTSINFIVNSVNHDNALRVDGASGKTSIGQTTGTHMLTVSGDASVLSLDVVGDTTVTQGDLIVSVGEMISGSTPLHDIFSTDTDIHGDMTVHGSISAEHEIITNQSLYVSGDIYGHEGTVMHGDFAVSGSLSATGHIETPQTVIADEIKAITAMHTTTGANIQVTGVTRDVNIGGHIIRIVNGLIVDVIDE